MPMMLQSARRSVSRLMCAVTMLGLMVPPSLAQKPKAPAQQAYVYTKLSDAKTCQFSQDAPANEEPQSETYVCPGPVKGIETRLLRGDDYDHLYLKIDGRAYSLWSPMVAVGAFAGMANADGTSEWVFTGGKAKGRANVTGLIVRFRGTSMNSDGMPGRTQSQLSVISLIKDKICWKGNFATNAQARAALAQSPCKNMLEAEI
jgi:hypothetical protein